MPPDTADEVADLMTRAERHLRASRGRLRRVASDDAELAIRVGCSVASVLEDNLPALVARQRSYRDWFEDDYLSTLGLGFDQLALLLTVGQHISSRCMSQFPGETRPARLEAVLELHAHSILVASEVLDLLRGGWPAGAEARWRTLHEIEVIALFLAKAPNTVAQRYLASAAIDFHRLASNGLLRLPPGRGSTAVRGELRKRASAAVSTHGEEISRQYGWAARWLRKKRVRFVDLERKVAPRRPAYISASNRVHAGRVGALASMLDRPNHFMVGRRPEGLADIGLQTVWSVNTVAGALLATAEAIAPADDFVIWDEAQTQLASEADRELRRGETTRLFDAGRGEEAAAYTASPSTAFIRFAREVASPQGR